MLITVGSDSGRLSALGLSVRRWLLQVSYPTKHAGNFLTWHIASILPRSSRNIATLISRQKLTCSWRWAKCIMIEPARTFKSRSHVTRSSTNFDNLLEPWYLEVCCDEYRKVSAGIGPTLLYIAFVAGSTITSYLPGSPGPCPRSCRPH